MDILRATVAIFLGLFFAFCALWWAEGTGIFVRDNFATQDAYEGAFNLALWIVFPLALASSSALVWRVLPPRISEAK